MLTKEWIEHWINDLLSYNLVMNKTFTEWMWCPERYNTETLIFIQKTYEERRFKILTSL